MFLEAALYSLGRVALSHGMCVHVSRCEGASDNLLMSLPTAQINRHPSIEFERSARRHASLAEMMKANIIPHSMLEPFWSSSSSRLLRAPSPCSPLDSLVYTYQAIFFLS